MATAGAYCGDEALVELVITGDLTVITDRDSQITAKDFRSD
jgi:hypothetical protein